MARAKSLLAIFLALALLVSPTVSVFADGPIPPREEGNPLDGHPWDDESTSSDPGPGNDPNTPGGNPVVGDLPHVSIPTSATSGSGSQFVAQLARTLIAKWMRLIETKAAKSKTVRPVR